MRWASPSLQMGVFGGILVGLGTAALHNRFYKIQLPQVLSFFSGTRFVPIISSAVYLLVGIAMYYIWPTIQIGINALGGFVLASGYAGTGIRFIERALIPFGLHHASLIPFWQTAVGGTAVVGGQLVEGAQNIFFAELVHPRHHPFLGIRHPFHDRQVPPMIFGLPGAAFAMYRCAKPENRKAVGGLLLSAALTSMLTGITEPLEFTFLFVAPAMYMVHWCAGRRFLHDHAHPERGGVGLTFSGGLIDLTLFGIMQGNEKTSWLWIPVVGVVYFVVYYFVFSFMIRKFNYMTPGRDDNAEAKLYTRKDLEARKKAGEVTEAEAADELRPDHPGPWRQGQHLRRGLLHHPPALHREGPRQGGSAAARIHRRFRRTVQGPGRSGGLRSPGIRDQVRSGGLPEILRFRSSRSGGKARAGSETR